METPRTKAGDLIEHIMAHTETNIDNRKAPKLSTAQYNAVYEAVLDMLQEESP